MSSLLTGLLQRPDPDPRLPAVQPTLTTPRLTLRPFTLTDAPRVALLAGDKRISATTATVPHPYSLTEAEAWVGKLAGFYTEGSNVVFAVTTTADTQLVGAIGLQLTLKHHHAELGYWTGVEFWNHGYTTEAARALLTFAFEGIGLNRVHAHFFATNHASGRVMVNCGMSFEGVRRQHVYKWGARHDAVCYGILASEWRAQNA
ncbi:GNAT family protein [soil metagenome]